MTKLVFLLSPSLLAWIFANNVNGSDPNLGGPAGWVGAGMLGGVLSWLLFVHLPAKDKQMHGFVDGFKETIFNIVKELTETHERRTTERLAMFTAAEVESKKSLERNLQLVIAHCERETAHVGERITSGMEEVTQAVTDFRRVLEERRNGE